MGLKWNGVSFMSLLIRSQALLFFSFLVLFLLGSSFFFVESDAARLDILSQIPIQVNGTTIAEQFLVTVSSDGTDELNFNVPMYFTPSASLAAGNFSDTRVVYLSGHLPYMDQTWQTEYYTPTGTILVPISVDTNDNFTSAMVDQNPQKIISQYKIPLAAAKGTINSQTQPALVGSDLSNSTLSNISEGGHTVHLFYKHDGDNNNNNDNENDHDTDDEQKKKKDKNKKLFSFTSSTSGQNNNEQKDIVSNFKETIQGQFYGTLKKPTFHLFTGPPPSMPFVESYNAALKQSDANAPYMDARAILAQCSQTSARSYIAQMIDFCNPNSLKPADDPSVVDCKVSQVCRLQTQCSGNDQCAQNLITELTLNERAVNQAQQTQELAFYRTFFRTAADSNNETAAFTVKVSKTLDDINSTLGGNTQVLQSQQGVVNTILETNRQLNDTVTRQGDLLQQVAITTDKLFTEQSSRLLSIMGDVAALNAYSSTLRQQLLTAMNILFDQVDISRVHMISLQQVSSFSYSIHKTLINIFNTLINRQQAKGTLVKLSQLAMAYLSSIGMAPILHSPGVAPGTLTQEEVVRIIGAVSVWQLQTGLGPFGNTTGVIRTTWTMRCNDAFLVKEMTPRDTFYDPPNWVGPRDCDVRYDSGFPCRCFVRELIQQSFHADVMNFLLEDFIHENSLEAGYSFTYNSLTYGVLNGVNNFNVTGQPEDNGTVTDSGVGNPLQPGSFDLSGLYQVVATNDYFSSPDFQTAVEKVCFNAYIPNAADVIDQIVGSPPPGETVSEHLQRLNNGVYSLVGVHSGSSYFSILDPDPSQRTYCVASADAMEEWLNVNRVGQLGPSIPFFLWSQFLYMMQAVDPEIQQVGSILEGQLPDPVSSETTRSKFIPGQPNSVTYPPGVNAVPSRGDAQASHRDTIFFAGQTAGQTPAHVIYNPHIVGDVKVYGSGSELIDAALIEETVIFNVPWGRIPVHWHYAGYWSCLYRNCAVRASVVDRVTGMIFGVLNLNPNPSGGSGPNGTEPGDSGMLPLAYDVPEHLFLQNGPGTPFYLATQSSGDQLSTGYYNNDTELEGPLFVRPSLTYLEYLDKLFQSREYDARSVSSSLSNYLIRLISDSNFTKRYDIQCPKTDRPSPDPDAIFCQILDNFYFEVNQTSHKIRLTPRSTVVPWSIQFLVTLPGEVELAPPPPPTTNGQTDGINRDVCPTDTYFTLQQSGSIRIDVSNTPTLASPSSGGTALDGRRIQIFTVGVCGSSSSSSTSKATIGLFSMEASDMAPFQTYSTSVTPCNGQTLIVASVNETEFPYLPSSPLYNAAEIIGDKNTVVCKSFQVNQISPVSYSTVRNQALEYHAVIADVVGELIRNTAEFINFAQNFVMNTTLTALAKIMAVRTASIENEVNTILGNTSAILQKVQNDVINRMNYSKLFLNSTLEAINADLDRLKLLEGTAQFQSAFNEQYNLSFALLQEILAEEAIVLPLLKQASARVYNVTNEIAGWNLLFGAASSNNSFASLDGNSLAFLSGIGCPSLFASAKNGGDEYYKSLTCKPTASDPFACVHGVNRGWRSLIYCILFFPVILLSGGLSAVFSDTSSSNLKKKSNPDKEKNKENEKGKKQNKKRDEDEKEEREQEQEQEHEEEEEGNEGQKKFHGTPWIGFAVAIVVNSIIISGIQVGSY